MKNRAGQEVINSYEELGLSIYKLSMQNTYRIENNNLQVLVCKESTKPTPEGSPFPPNKRIPLPTTKNDQNYMDKLKKKIREKLPELNMIDIILIKED